MKTDSPAIACAQLAMHRASALMRFELGRGINGLATVASLAPWIGILLTCLGILNSFTGSAGEKSTMFARTAARLAQAPIPTAVGLAIAIFAYAFRRHLQTQVESLALEMNLASSALLACLRPLEKMQRMR